MDVAGAPPARLLAAVGVVGLAVALALLPVLVALGVASETVARVALGLGSLVAVSGGVKLGAAILGALRFAAGSSPGVTKASLD